MTTPERVLATLRHYGPHSGHGLSVMLDVPQASIRRAVQELRADGHNISFATGSNALYTLHQETV